MIYLKIQGRLGNQMFQYAFAKKIQKDFYPNEEIVINYSKSKFSNNCIFCDKINPFNFNKLNSSNVLKINIIQKLILYLYMLLKAILNNKISDIKFQKFLNWFGIYFLQDPGICNFKKSKMKHKIIYGYFASEYFFQNVKEEVINDFSMKSAIIKDSNVEFLKKIKSNNSICVSIRRGDYLNPDISNYFNVCTPNYYYNAINQANKEIVNPLFVIFSDDINWVKNNMNLPKNCIFENPKNNVFETFYLMRCCKHFIISNSTFHWWAQYLSISDNKIVYAPNIWNNENVAREIYLKKWILIDVKGGKKFNEKK